MARSRNNHKSKTKNQLAIKGGRYKHITRSTSKSVKQQPTNLEDENTLHGLAMKSWYEHIGSFVEGIPNNEFMCCVWPFLVDDEANQGLWT
jgi:hypothetical protein